MLQKLVYVCRSIFFIECDIQQPKLVVAPLNWSHLLINILNTKYKQIKSHLVSRTLVH